jgi:hypothetical protein
MLTLNTPRQKADCPNNLEIATMPKKNRPELPNEIIAKLDTLTLPESGNLIGFFADIL